MTPEPPAIWAHRGPMGHKGTPEPRDLLVTRAKQGSQGVRAKQGLLGHRGSRGSRGLLGARGHQEMQVFIVAFVYSDLNIWKLLYAVYINVV